MQLVMHVLLPVTLFSLMFAMGLRISLHDFAELVPRWPLVLGVFGSLAIVLPAAATTLVRVFGLQPELGLGIVLISACPVGTFSTVLAAYGRANIALSVCLTALTSLLAVLTLPLIVNVAGAGALPAHAVHLPWLPTVLRVLSLIGLPVALGMLARAHLGPRAERWHRIIKNAGAAALILVFATLIHAERHELAAALAAVWAPVVVLNGCALAAGLAFRHALGASQDIGLSIALAHTIRQEETGLYVALSLLAIP